MATPIKFPQLTDKAWVLEQLKTLSAAQLAKQVGCPRSSVQWVLDRYCTAEERATVKVERKRTKRVV